MGLKLVGSVQANGRRNQIWNLIFDTVVLSKILNRIPGIRVERLVQIAEDKYEITAVMGVAMVKGKYDGIITIVEKQEPSFVRFRGEGKGGGNWTAGEMAIKLDEVNVPGEDAKTQLTYEGTGNVSGTLASVGQRLIDSVGKQFVQHGSKALAEELAAGQQAKVSAHLHEAK